jgi:hypothetical protein
MEMAEVKQTQGFLRRKAAVETVEVDVMALQESNVVKNFFMEVARASDKLTAQDQELASLRQECAGLKAELQLAQRDAQYKVSALDRVVSDLTRQRQDMQHQRDAALTAFMELRSHIGVIQAQCAAVVEAGAGAHQAAVERVRQLGMDERRGVEVPHETLANLEAELIGKKYGNSNAVAVEQVE